jgi:hypothetical protein
LALRPEYITSSGSLASGTANLLYGPGSNAFAFTVTPTYQKGGFFIRADASVVDARSFTVGDAFGPLGKNGTQTRGVVEAGVLFRGLFVEAARTASAVASKRPRHLSRPQLHKVLRRA